MSLSQKCKLNNSAYRFMLTMLEWSKSRTLMPNAGEDVEQQELKFFAGGNAKWYSYFGR